MTERNAISPRLSAQDIISRRGLARVAVIADRGERAELVLLPADDVRAGHRFSLGDVGFEIVGRRPHGKAWVASPNGHRSDVARG